MYIVLWVWLDIEKGFWKNFQRSKILFLNTKRRIKNLCGYKDVRKHLKD